jgi:5'(3')-deoxyribonucleotidase
MEWTQDNTLSFTELYEKTSVLWDPNHPKHSNKLHKHDAWEEITKAMGTVPDECKKKMTSFSPVYFPSVPQQ